MRFVVIARVLTAILTVIVLAVFYIFAARSIAGDDDGFLMFFAAVIIIMAIAAVVNILRPLFRKEDAADIIREKECASCGALMDAIAHTCPRCGVIQPEYGKKAKRQ
jgi:hypothetical protein